MAKQKGHDFTHQVFNELWKKIESRYEKETEKKLRPNEYVELVNHLRKFPDVKIHLPEPKENEGQTIYRAYLESQKPVNKAPIITIAVDFAQALISYANGMAVTPMDEYYIHLSSYYTKEGTLGEANISLKSLYIEPKISVFYENDLHDKPLIESVHNWLSDNIEISNLYNNILFIIGDPGQGKTSLCYRLLYDLWASNKIPFFFLKLRYLKNVNEFYKNPFEVIFEAINNDGFYREDNSTGTVKVTEKDFIESIIILDGLDELEKIHGIDKDLFCEKISKLTRVVFRPKKLIITSRKEINWYFLERKRIACWALSDLDIEEQMQWITNYNIYSNKKYELNKSDLEILNNKSFGARHLMRQPILLHILAQLNMRPNQNYNASKIYDELFDRIVSRYWNDVKAKRDPHPVLEIESKEQLRLILREVGLQMYHLNRTYLRQDEIPISIIEQFKMEQIENDSIFKNLLIAFYFNYKRIDETGKQTFAIEFLHRSFGDYLAAEALWQGIKDIFSSIDTPKEEKLSMFCKLFNSPIFLSKEIVEYLNQLINTSYYEGDSRKRNYSYIFSVYGLMKLDLNYFMKAEFSSHSYPKSIKNSLQNFYAYITFFTRISYDFSQNIYKDLFENYLKQLSLINTSINLSGCEFRSFNLENIVLKKAKLTKINFQTSSLRRADLSFSDLTDARLEYTDFSFADLSNGDLSGASCYRANLSHTNLSMCKLNGVDFSQANLSNCSLFDKIELEENMDFDNTMGYPLGTLIYDYRETDKLLLAESILECKGIPQEILVRIENLKKQV